jgi:hypothetical protein
LEIHVALTREVAENFGCRDLIYAGTVPRSGVNKMELEGSETDCDVHLKHDSFAFQTVCEKVDKYFALMEGDGPKLTFHVTFTGYVITVADLIEHVKIDPLEVTLKPAQIPMDLHEEKVDGGCVDCNNDIPFAAFMDPDGTTGSDLSLHVSGQPCANYRPPTEEPAAVEPAAAPLASAREAVGGTHQKGRKKNQPAPVVEPEFDADELIN